MQQGRRRTEHLRALTRPHRAEVTDPVPVDMRLDPLGEVALVLDDPADHQPPAGTAGDVDGHRGALVRMDPAEHDQVLPADGRERQRRHVDTVMDRGDIVQLRTAVGVGDGHVRRPRPRVRRDDTRVRKAVDGRHHRRPDVRRERQR